VDVEGADHGTEPRGTSVSKTYAIADLHGRHDLLTGAINAIADMDHGPLTFVTLGDYIDRGPESAKVISTLMDIRANPPKDWNVICLKGNHEDMMVETLRKPLHPDWWIGNGGGATLVSYGHPKTGYYDPTRVPAEHIAWIDALPLMHVDDHRVFVHAWVDSSIPLDRQKPDSMLWTLYPPGARYGHRLSGRHVVHGHHQFEDGPKLYRGRTDLDTFAWHTGRLVIGVFDDDLPGGPIEIVEVFGNGEWKRGESREVENSNDA
jgi:serine/threonine protein phosphatase 1